MSKVLVSADRLTATYSNQTLTLCAVGSVPGYISQIHFQRLIWFGGLRVELTGWSEVGIPEYRPYKCEQSIFIPDLGRTCPSGYIIVETANHPQGQKVPVRWLGFNGEPVEQPLSVAAGSDTLKAIDREPTTIKVLFREPFDIKESVDTTPGSTLRTQFNDKSLTTENAGYEDGNMKWTMNSLETGITQFIVYKTHGLTDLVVRKLYNIEVIVLDNAVTSADTQSLEQGADLAIPLLTFKDRLRVAEGIMKRYDSAAKLITVKAKQGLIPIVPVFDGKALKWLEAWFQSEHRLWKMKSTSGMYWSTPSPQPDIILGLMTFSVDDLKLGICDAVNKMREAGQIQGFWFADVYAPLTRVPSNPEYVFRMEDFSAVSVDAKTGTVTVQEPAIPSISADSSKGAEGETATDGTNGASATALKQIEAPLPPVGVAA